MNDIYFKKDYARLYEKIEGGAAEEFCYEGPEGTVKNLFIKREIPLEVEGGPYYDLTTPYGYGGPIILDCKNGDRDGLVKAYEAAFQRYCNENNVVCEFVRFHPLFNNAADFKECYEIRFKRKTIQTWLKGWDDLILHEYSSSCRRDIRQSLRAGVEFQVVQNPDDLHDFKKIYYSTMNRNDADSIYYFDDDYFENCMKLLGEYLVTVEVMYEGKTIGMSISFACGDAIHAHLTGTLKEYHRLAPAYVLQYALALWGEEHGYERIHHGGGRTGEKDDKLYQFKKKFSKSAELDYFTGHRIWDPEVYALLCEKAGAEKSEDILPAYRLAAKTEKTMS
ncbi:FemAB family protein [Planococcus massiliensis]|uniref:Lipid II:glycine glycyltransferase n=1 Tax=Planococcus massiliensis TaxID=1499687 RepID=A0A098EIH1_9BACL|nr:GNAT family N-acetyltransferase [Planococcus massiliensis]CEG22094.1 FemAB family protein [Planococcus massiliensis]